MKKMILLSVVVLCVGSLAGCTTGTAKIVEQLKGDPAEVHLVVDRNGLKLDRTNPNPNTNAVPASPAAAPATEADALKAKMRQVLDGK